MSVTDIISIASSVIVAMIVYYMQRRQKRSDDEMAKRADARRSESLLSLEMMMANNKLSYAVAMAVKRGKANGEVEEAVKAYDEAKKKYYAFLNGQAIDNLNK